MNSLGFELFCNIIHAGGAEQTKGLFFIQLSTCTCNRNTPTSPQVLPSCPLTRFQMKKGRMSTGGHDYKMLQQQLFSKNSINLF